MLLTKTAQDAVRQFSHGKFDEEKGSDPNFCAKNHHRDQSTYKVYEDETQTNGKVHSRFNLDLLRFPALGDDFNFRLGKSLANFYISSLIP